MKCGSCGARNKSQSAFCEFCGAAVGEAKHGVSNKTAFVIAGGMVLIAVIGSLAVFLSNNAKPDITEYTPKAPSATSEPPAAPISVAPREPTPREPTPEEMLTGIWYYDGEDYFEFSLDGGAFYSSGGYELTWRVLDNGALRLFEPKDEADAFDFYFLFTDAGLELVSVNNENDSLTLSEEPLALSPDTVNYHSFKDDVLIMVRYYTAVRLMDGGRFAEAYNSFLSLGGYKDSLIMLDECRYRRARELARDGYYDDALERYNEMPAYKDSAEQIMEVSYLKGQELFNDGKYGAAYNMFVAAGGYGNAGDMRNECRYQRGLELMAQKNYSGAAERFASLGVYKDAAQMLAQCNLQITLSANDSGR